ncbi:PAS domain-containing protein [Duganella sp. P38]|uniref:PAS domain-containing sensor histidine kinase n=1 Tax=Duganella sp. P38 TaxID=3423949 RepID=UPI003D79569C
MRRSAASPDLDMSSLLRWLQEEHVAGADLQKVVRRMPLPLFVKDGASRLLMMNPACEAMWGIRFADIAGSDGTGLYPPEQLRIYHEHDRLAFARGATIIEEAPLWHAGMMQLRWMITHKHPVYDDDGQPHLLIGSCLDITERRHRETALEQALAVARQAAGSQQDATERQHRRLTLDLREDLAQNLVALKLDLATLHARTGAAQPLLHQRAAQALSTLDASLAAVRDIINELHPATLELGLSAAVEWQLQQLGQRGTRCVLRVADDSATLDQQRSGALFHLIRQGLDYAAGQQPGTLEVELSLGRERLAVTITSAAPLSAANAEVLVAMRNRLTGLGGKLDLSRHSLRLIVPGQALSWAEGREVT